MALTPACVPPDFPAKIFLTEAKRQSLVPAHRGWRLRLPRRGRRPFHQSRMQGHDQASPWKRCPKHAGHVYGMLSEDVYMRFFQRVSALTYEEAQRLCNVDFERDVAFVAVSGPRENEEISAQAPISLNPSTNVAEVAYMISCPKWEASGTLARLCNNVSSSLPLPTEFADLSLRSCKPAMPCSTSPSVSPGKSRSGRKKAATTSLCCSHETICEVSASLRDPIEL